MSAPEVVFEFHDQMPTGVTVADDGRIFVCYPRWGDKVDFTVAELRDGQEVPFPDAEVNVFDEARPSETLVGVQSVVVDPAGKLWLLDTGSIELQPHVEGGAKLVRVDLQTNAIDHTIVVPSDVALETTYLNDIRFDLRRGYAFITDSSLGEGPGGIIVVNLETGACHRALHDHPSTRIEEGYLAIIEGQPLPGLAMTSDGIAISHDGERLYYCPFGGRRLYSASVEALIAGEAEDTVRDHGQKGSSDGLESGADGSIFATNYEQGAILRRTPEGEWEAVVRDAGLLFVDTLAVAADGFIYYTVNQLHRQPDYQGGEDRRKKPCHVMRSKVDVAPVRLR